MSIESRIPPGPTSAKVTVLYGHPAEPDEFEEYYRETHLPLARRIPGLQQLEAGRVVGGGGDGTPPAYYRIAELYFAHVDDVGRGLESSEGQAAVDDIPKFATGGATVLISEVG